LISIHEIYTKGEKPFGRKKPMGGPPLATRLEQAKCKKSVRNSRGEKRGRKGVHGKSKPIRRKVTHRDCDVGQTKKKMEIMVKHHAIIKKKSSRKALREQVLRLAKKRIG